MKAERDRLILEAHRGQQLSHALKKQWQYPTVLPSTDDEQSSDADSNSEEQSAIIAASTAVTRKRSYESMEKVM